MKLVDRLWLRLNKKRPGRISSYFYMVGTWPLVGVLLLLGFATLLAYVEKSAVVSVLLIGPLVGLAGIGLGLFLYRMDSEKGYVDAVYSHHLKRWEERKRRLEDDSRGVMK